MTTGCYGHLQLITGCMYSGKSSELLRRANRLFHAGRKFQAYKPIIDTRYEGTEVINSHDGARLDAVPVHEPAQILSLLEPDTRFVFIDEVQFFDKTIIRVAHKLFARHIIVVAAGLDTNFRGEPFGLMRELTELAQTVRKLTAICPICRRPAIRTQRLVDGKPAHYDSPLIVIGADETYQARCLQHHVVPRGELKD